MLLVISGKDVAQACAGRETPLHPSTKLLFLVISEFFILFHKKEWILLTANSLGGGESFQRILRGGKKEPAGLRVVWQANKMMHDMLNDGINYLEFE